MRQLTEEQKQKMAAGRKAASERRKLQPVAASGSLEERITANVLKALQGAGVIPNGKPSHRKETPDYEVPSLTSRANAIVPEPEPEPEPEPTIDPAIERFIALVEQITPKDFSYESVSAMLVAVRSLEQKLRDRLVSQPPSTETIRCAVCRCNVNPQRPVAVRVRKNVRTGIDENLFFDKQACVLMYDSSRKGADFQPVGQRVTLEPGQ
ncbi:MAG TPA: hypothetical protein VGT24_01600 [Candidatus Acidoferrales bacterium]|nr:hypothetical protein [Candidatus Acidoferrales bacterium]